MIEQFLEKEKQNVNEYLVQYFKDLENEEDDVFLKDFIHQYKEFVLNEKAKRLHPILLIAGFVGIINPIYLEMQLDEIRKTSIAVELMHTGHLIHDDLLDKDLIRRDKPTFHVQLMNELKEIYNNSSATDKQWLIKEYGRDLSILGGTEGYLLGLDVIKKSHFPDKLKMLAINEYTSAMNYLMKGQIIEEYMNYHNITMTIEQYLSLIEMQRARLMEESVKIGAILAKGNYHYQIKPLSEAMLKIGQAFAIRDDILDMREDIKARAKRIIYILALQNANEEQSQKLKEIYSQEEVSKNDIEIVERIFAETNAVIIAEHFSKNLVVQAKNYLKEIYPDLNKEQKVFFNEFADYIYMRDF
ncbi:MAG: polyprenyl synthetase family protein [Promethearchaeota archaeon]